MNRMFFAAVVAFTSPSVLADGPIGRDAAGVTVGFYVGDGFLTTVGGNSQGESQGFVSLSGYRFWAVPRSGVVDGRPALGGNQFEIHYSGMNCTGQPYATELTAPGFVTLEQRPPAAPGISLLYVPKGASLVPGLATLSRRQPGAGCQNNATGFDGYLLLPNDPAVTGVPAADFTPPITLSRSDLLRDGFEDPQASMSESTAETFLVA